MIKCFDSHNTNVLYFILALSLGKISSDRGYDLVDALRVVDNNTYRGVHIIPGTGIFSIKPIIELVGKYSRKIKLILNMFWNKKAFIIITL